MTGQEAEVRLPLDWVDEFISQIRAHISVRAVDRLLIVLPNQSYHLNASGLRLLEALLGGKRLSELVNITRLDAAKRRDLFDFFTSLVGLMKGCLGDGRGWRSVERIPYERPHHLLPVLSEIAITGRCNLACRFCYASGPRTAPPPDLDTASVLKLLNVIRRDAQIPSVSFTGGEPTLRADLPQLVQAAHDEGLRVNLITNGTRIDTILAAKLRDAGLASAQVSIEGPDAGTHDSLTAVSGSFEASLRGIQALKDAGILVHTNTTLSGENVSKAERMPAFVKSIGMERLSMNMVIPSAAIREHDPGLLLKYSDIGALVLKVRDAARIAGIKFLWYSPTPYCLFNPIAHRLGSKGCAACDGLLSIDSQGRLLPCSSFYEPQGSLLESSFEDVWNAASTAGIRRKERAPAACRDCEQFGICEGACPLYWNVMGCGELSSPGTQSGEYIGGNRK
ncbi:MAG TPA: radical SAM protein [Candidatus Ozemobacteraceae bacterium]|nr:radical SAM protein [Candidatus Ozemobacteraceae bacterium]